MVWYLPRLPACIRRIGLGGPTSRVSFLKPNSSNSVRQLRGYSWHVIPAEILESQLYIVACPQGYFKNISQNFLPPRNLFVELEMTWMEWMEREIVLIWMKLYLPFCCFLFEIFAV